jgi:hypothetical protein
LGAAKPDLDDPDDQNSFREKRLAHEFPPLRCPDANLVAEGYLVPKSKRQHLSGPDRFELSGSAELKSACKSGSDTALFARAVTR